MIAPLVAVAIVVQVADLVTYALAPQFEAGALRALPVWTVALVKVLGVGLVLLLSLTVTRRWLVTLLLGLVIAAGAFGTGCNIATLSIVRAAEQAPRPSAPVIPAARWGFGEPDPERTTAAPSLGPVVRTPSPTNSTRAASTEAPATAKPCNFSP